MILSAAAFAALGVMVSVAVQEVFEAQTLANMFRFPMMFLSGVFVPLSALPPGLRIVARVLPLTYARFCSRWRCGRWPARWRR